MIFISEKATAGVCAMLTVSGAISAYPQMAGAVMGRLVFSDSGIEKYYGEAHISVIPRGIETQGSEAVNDNTVGIVRICDSTTSRTPDGLPAICVSGLPRWCEGRIAILDPESKRLFVSPDLATVNRYFPKKNVSRTQTETRPQILPVFSHPSEIRGETYEFLFDGLPPCRLEGEEETYNFYRDIAERATGIPITVTVSADKSLPDRLCALYRSAVYGRFSLLFRGILTSLQLSELLGESNSAFCRLQSDGREFNGYVKRGICIDSPYLMRSKTNPDGFDFLVVDAERILRLETNCAAVIPDTVLRELANNVTELCRKGGGMEYSVILGEKTLSAAFSEIVFSGGFSKVYVQSRR